MARSALYHSRPASITSYTNELNTNRSKQTDKTQIKTPKTHTIQTNIYHQQQQFICVKNNTTTSQYKQKLEYIMQMRSYTRTYKTRLQEQATVTLFSMNTGRASNTSVQFWYRMTLDMLEDTDLGSKGQGYRVSITVIIQQYGVDSMNSMSAYQF